MSTDKNDTFRKSALKKVIDEEKNTKERGRLANFN